MNADWDGLEEVLRGCERVTAEECAYLKTAFVATEQMWAENFAKVATVRFVLLSEAPLFGANKRYFYNIATPFGAFFHFRDAEAILGQDFAKDRSGKEFLLAELARAGFMILDLFPFALNKDDTPSVTYRKMSVSRYRQLFQRAASFYFDRKRDVILQRGRPLFVFRYGATRRALGDLVNAELAKRNIGPAQSVGGPNMPLDRERLRQFCQRLPIAPGVADYTHERPTHRYCNWSSRLLLQFGLTRFACAAALSCRIRGVSWAWVWEG
jgi:hypothetical protein